MPSMRYGNIPGLNVPVSRLIQGGVQIGGRPEAESFALLDGAFALGCTAFETAACYSDGESERVLGRWVAERGVRDRVLLFTKGAHPTRDRARVTPFDIQADVHDSLARLRTDHIDLFLLHRDDPSVPVGPLVEALDALRRAGKLRAYGGSNWSHLRIDEANAYAAAHGLARFAASSPNYSLADRVREPWEGCLSIGGEAGREAREYYARTGTPLLAWSSLAGGFFSGRFRRDNLNSFSEYLDGVCIDAFCHEVNFQRLDRARVLAAELGLTPPQVALAWLLNRPLDIYALVGCRTAEEFRENLRALEVPWHEEYDQRLGVA